MMQRILSYILALTLCAAPVFGQSVTPQIGGGIGKGFDGGINVPVAVATIPNQTFNWTAEGDSITIGLGGVPSYPFVALAAMPGASLTTVTPNVKATSPLSGGGNITLTDVATSGISTLTLDQNYSSRAGANFQAGQVNILSYMAGTNTSGASDTSAQQKYALIRDYLRNARNTGYTRIVIGNMIARDDDGGFAWTNTLVPLNGFIDSLYNSDLQADFEFNFAGDSRFNNPATVPTGGLYAGDLVHPNVPGEAAMGSISTTNLLAVLRNGGAQTFATPTWSFFNTGLSPGDGTATLSNSNRTAAGGAGTGTYQIRGLPGTRTTKIYFEVDVATVAVGPGPGIATDNFNFASGTFFGQDAGGNGLLWEGNGVVIVKNITIGTANAYVAGDNLGLALDPVNKLIWLRVTHSGVPGNWNNSGTANPATGVGGISFSSMTALGLGDRFYPAGAVQIAGDTLLSRFAASQMLNAAPAGFQTFAP